MLNLEHGALVVDPDSLQPLPPPHAIWPVVVLPPRTAEGHPCTIHYRPTVGVVYYTQAQGEDVEGLVAGVASMLERAGDAHLRQRNYAVAATPAAVLRHTGRVSCCNVIFGPRKNHAASPGGANCRPGDLLPARLLVYTADGVTTPPAHYGRAGFTWVFMPIAAALAIGERGFDSMPAVNASISAIFFDGGRASTLRDGAEVSLLAEDHFEVPPVPDLFAGGPRRGGEEPLRGEEDRRRGGEEPLRGEEDRRGGEEDRRGGEEDRRGGEEDRRGGEEDRRDIEEPPGRGPQGGAGIGPRSGGVLLALPGGRLEFVGRASNLNTGSVWPPACLGAEEPLGLEPWAPETIALRDSGGLFAEGLFATEVSRNFQCVVCEAPLGGEVVVIRGARAPPAGLHRHWHNHGADDDHLLTEGGLLLCMFCWAGLESPACLTTHMGARVTRTVIPYPQASAAAACPEYWRLAPLLAGSVTPLTPGAVIVQMPPGGPGGGASVVLAGKKLGRYPAITNRAIAATGLGVLPGVTLAEVCPR